MRKHDVVNLRGLKRGVSGQRMVERAGEAVHICEESLRFAPEFLGRNVVRGSPDLLGVIHSRLRFAGQAEVDQLGFTVHVEQDISRLDVAMQQIVLQRGIQCRGNLDAYIQHQQLRHRLVCIDQSVETPRAGQFHHEIKLIVVFAELVKIDDVRVVQLRHGPCLGVKRLQPLFILGQFRLHQLDGHVALQHRV